MELGDQVCALAFSNREGNFGGSRCKGVWVKLSRDLHAAKKSWPGVFGLAATLLAAMWDRSFSSCIRTSAILRVFLILFNNFWKIRGRWLQKGDVLFSSTLISEYYS